MVCARAHRAKRIVGWHGTHPVTSVRSSMAETLQRQSWSSWRVSAPFDPEGAFGRRVRAGPLAALGDDCASLVIERLDVEGRIAMFLAGAPKARVRAVRVFTQGRRIEFAPWRHSYGFGCHDNSHALMLTCGLSVRIMSDRVVTCGRDRDHMHKIIHKLDGLKLWQAEPGSWRPSSSLEDLARRLVVGGASCSRHGFSTSGPG